MKQVWLLMQGEYSDKRVVGVFTEEDKAHDFTQRYSGQFDEYSVEGPYVVDPIDVKAGDRIFDVVIQPDGDVLSCNENDGKGTQRWGAEWERTDGSLVFTVVARNVTHAIKIAGEKRIKWLTRPQRP